MMRKTDLLWENKMQSRGGGGGGWKTRSMLLPLEIQGKERLKGEEESPRVESFTEIKHDKV